MHRHIVVGFSKPKKKILPFFSWFIRIGESIEHLVYSGKWEYQQFSHTYVSWQAQRFERTIVYEASGSSVHFLGEDAAQEHLEPVELYRIPTTEEAQHRMVQICLTMAGTDYGLLNVAGVVWVKLIGVISWLISFRNYRVRVRNPFADGRESQPCMEVVGRLLEPHLTDKPSALEDWGVRDIRDFVRSLPGVERIL